MAVHVMQTGQAGWCFMDTGKRFSVSGKVFAACGWYSLRLVLLWAQAGMATGTMVATLWWYVLGQDVQWHSGMDLL